MSRRARRFAVRAAVLAPRLLPVVAVEVLAQPVAAWEAGGGLTRGPSAPGGAPGAWTDDGRLGSALRWGGAHGALMLDGAAGLRGGDWQGAGRLAGFAVSPTWRGLRLSAGASGRLASPLAPTSLAVVPLGVAPPGVVALDARAVGTAEARLSYAQGGSGLWVGMDAAAGRRVPAVLPSLVSGRPDTLAPMAAIRPHPERIAAGAWRQRGGLVIGLSVGSRAVFLPAGRDSMRPVRVFEGLMPRSDSSGTRMDTLWSYKGVRVPGTPARTRRLSEIESQLSWASGRLALDAAGGFRPRTPGVPSAAWAEGVGSLALGSRTALVASGATAPASTGATRAHFSLGLRVAPRVLHRPMLPPVVRPLPTDFEVRSAPAGQYVFSVRLPGARAVELSGDFTAWKPVALRQVSADRWEIALAVTPGTHHCNVRVDGDRWVAPPGTTAVDDDFNGRVGLIVVP